MDEEVVKKAKEMGLNLSKLCENCLKQAIKGLESTIYKNNQEKGGIGTAGSDRCGCRDLNPGSQAWKA
jgi:post-segregation antitoxin (ccd killing protein)